MDKVDSLKKVENEIQKARQSGANLLLPSTNIGELSDFHAPVVDSVYLSPNPKDGDVYPANYQDDCDEFRLAAQGLRKLSVCAGIMWHPQECGRIDNRSDRDYVSYRSMGGIRKADGVPVWWRGEYDLDFEVIEEELYEQYRQKCKNWKKSDDVKQGYIKSSVKRDMLFKRRHRIKLAETGSINRVIRAILGLKNSYTREELSKPFVMVRIVLRPDYNDKEVRAKLADAAIKSMTGVYGVDTPPVNTPQDDIESPTEENIIDVPAMPDDETLPPKEDDEPTEEEIFAGHSTDDQIKTLKDLAKKKGYKLSDLKFPVEQFTEKHRLDFFIMLNGMSDEDDIPF